MAKKERSYNPAQEQHKKDKKRAIEKLKRERQNNQLKRISRKNPASLEAQIRNLKQIEAQGRLPDADRAILASLEKELRLVKRAKAQYADGPHSGPEIVSDRTKALEAERIQNKERDQNRTFREILKNKRDPKRSVYYDEVWNPYGVPPPGMPWREREDDDSDGWSTDSEVRRIPMPKDTPPPTTPHPRSQQREQPVPQRQRTPPRPTKKTPEPEMPIQGPSATIEDAFLRAGATTIEVAPVIRDFQKEAVAFVPSVVKRRPPPPPKLSAKVERVESVVEKSFATTVEDGNDEEEESLTGPSDAMPAKPSPEKRQREVEVETKPPQQQPPPPAPPKRRRLVNAAPDV